MSGIAIALAVAGAGPAVAGPTRHVVGELSVHGAVWTQEDGGGASEASVRSAGAPLLERTRIRTGADAAALLTLGRDGVVGLRAGSRAAIGTWTADAAPITLLGGEALVRLPAGSRLAVATPTATVQAEPIQTVSTTPSNDEASIRVLPDGRTLVRVESGSLRVETREGEAAVVKAGEQTTLGHDGTPRIVQASTAARTMAAPVPAAAVRSTASGVGIFSDDAMIAGLAAVGVTAGTLGGLGAAGDLGNGGGSDSSADTSGQGSPFKPGHGNHGHHGHGNNGHGNGHGDD